MAKSKKQVYIAPTEDTLTFVIKRFNEMDAERCAWLPEWHMCDLQYEAPIIVDNNGKIIVNCQLEQSLIEMEEGRREGMPTYDVKPDPYTADIAQTESAKYILDAFLDRENFYKELLLADQNGDKYGTEILFCGIRIETEIIKVPVDQEVEDKPWVVLYGLKKKMKDEVRENYFMTPANVPIRYFWVDDKAFYQSDFDKAEDCIMLEKLSKEVFYQRYKNNSIYNQETVDAASLTQNADPAYGQSPALGMIEVYHYFNKTTKQYAIVVNKEMLLLDTFMMYKHGKLPFSVGQRFPNVGCIYGFSIPRKVRVWKGYKNNIVQSIIDGARLNSGKIVVSAEDPTDGEMEITPGEISLMKFTGGISSTQTIDTRVDINGSIAALKIIDDEVRKDTGIDQSAPIWPQANTLGQTEIIEENKALRQRTSDQLRDHFLDRALTLTLSNIAQFAPHLLKEWVKVKDDEGKEITQISKRPMIQIENVTIKKKNGTITIIEDYGNYGYLELNPKTLDGQLGIRITTPSTWNKVLSSLQKDKAEEMVNTYAKMVEIFWPQVLQQKLPPDEIIDAYKQAYNISENMTPKTKKSLEKKEAIAYANKVKQFINWTPEQNEQPNIQNPQEVMQTTAETVGWGGMPQQGGMSGWV